MDLPSLPTCERKMSVDMTGSHQPAQRKLSVDLMAENNRLRLELHQAVEDLEISQQIQDHLEAALTKQNQEWSHALSENHNPSEGVNDIGKRLLAAVKNNDVRSVVELLHEADKLDIEYDDDSGSTALIHATKFGYIELVGILLNHGASVDHIDFSRSTALIYASKHGLLEIARILVDNGADVNHRNIYALTPLICASKYGRTETAKFLLERGALVNLVNFHGTTALTSAAFHGKTKIVQLLLENGADIDHQDRSGWTALIAAVQRGYREIVKLLLQHGANVEIKAESGWTALFFAVKINDVEIGEILLDHGAFPNVRSTHRFAYFVPSARTSTVIGSSWTPLMMASYLNYGIFAKLLLLMGADKLLKNDDGKTAMDLAASDEMRSLF